jgi:hypothetical protein
LPADQVQSAAGAEHGEPLLGHRLQPDEVKDVVGSFGKLRAAMSMGRLWRNQGKRDEAGKLLAPVYGWFTEEFDTLDLKEAKALLGELAS